MFKRKPRKGALAEPLAEQAWSMRWRFATYLGGLDVGPKRSLGTLWFTEEAIGLGKKKPTDVVIPLSDVVSVEIADRPARTTAKAALGQRSAKSSTVTIFTKSGSRAEFRVLVDAASSKAVASRFLEKVGISFYDELASASGDSPHSAAT